MLFLPHSKSMWVSVHVMVDVSMEAFGMSKYPPDVASNTGHAPRRNSGAALWPLQKQSCRWKVGRDDVYQGFLVAYGCRRFSPFAVSAVHNGERTENLAYRVEDMMQPYFPLVHMMVDDQESKGESCTSRSIWYVRLDQISTRSNIMLYTSRKKSEICCLLSCQKRLSNCQKNHMLHSSLDLDCKRAIYPGAYETRQSRSPTPLSIVHAFWTRPFAARLELCVSRPVSLVFGIRSPEIGASCLHALVYLEFKYV